MCSLKRLHAVDKNANDSKVYVLISESPFFLRLSSLYLLPLISLLGSLSRDILCLGKHASFLCKSSIVHQYYVAALNILLVVYLRKDYCLSYKTTVCFWLDGIEFHCVNSGHLFAQSLWIEVVAHNLPFPTVLQ